jgi:potassium/hydrogen antiporter
LFELIVLGIAVLLLLSIIVSKASSGLGVPALLIFLTIGMVIGSDGLGFIYFDNYELARNLGVVALVFILFSGGMDTNWEYSRPAQWKGFSLATVGVLLTAVIVASVVVYVLNFSWLEGLLLGAIVSSTDAAAVFSIMRSKGVSLRGQLAPIIELESGSNDPMAVFLTTAVIGLLINPQLSALSLLYQFALQMGMGAFLGYLFGRTAVFILNRLNLEYEGLYPVFTIAWVLFTYSATEVLWGNGFLAVYLAGIIMGNANLIHRNSLRRFHDGLAWLMQITMFLALGLLVFPSQLPAVIGTGLFVSVILIFVARPLSVFISLLIFRMSIRENLMIGWVGLRGAVPIILATFPLLAGVTQSNAIFNLVFFIVLTSVVIQGTTIPWVARLLRVDSPMRRRIRTPLEFEPSAGIQGELFEIELPASSPAVGKPLVDLALPKGVLFVLIGRREEFFTPTGSTILEAGDIILLLSDRNTLEQVQKILNAQPTLSEATKKPH